MLRASLIAVAIVAVAALASGPEAVPAKAADSAPVCGLPGYQACRIANDACVLLSPAVLASVVGRGWTRNGSGPMRPIAGAALINDCMYNGPHEDEDATLEIRAGGPAQFKRTVQDFRQGIKPVSGVGDAAYIFAFPGSPANGVELWVIRKGVYFDLKVYSANPKLTQWGTTLARKVANGIR